MTMQFKKLGNTDIDVSLICLGTMTWGEQNSKEDAFEQMNYAVENGINFFDTAELYAVPPKEETYGRTESYIGEWFEQKKNRDKIILASKVTGRSGMKWMRGEETRLDKKNITKALEDSLKRLKTDYLDLYQLHWPDRKTNFFGQLGYEHDENDDSIPLENTLEVLNDLVKKGMVRYIGISNDTPWGAMQLIKIAEQKKLARIASIQNPYNLLNRTYEIGLAEVSIKENCGLLAYSPLGFGVLSGKYLNNQWPEKARLTLFKEFTRYLNPTAIKCTEEYVNIAKENNLSPAQMSLAYINAKPFVTSNIIGATTLDQLKENINSIDIKLDEKVIEKIEEIHKKNPNPCP